MINLQNISLSFGKRVIFDNITWMIGHNDRVGFVGDNGVGKTTLFRAILGDQEPDEGRIIISGKNRKNIGYLPQDVAELPPLPLMDYLRDKSGITKVEENIRQWEDDLAHLRPEHVSYDEVLKNYEQAVQRFQWMDGYAFDARAKQMLCGFGFHEDDFVKNCAEFSGGWKMRILLSVILLASPAIMLLDEPTNHLDTESMEWLESYLRDYQGCLLAISHDHMFLDKMVGQIAELSHGKIYLFRGNYSDYQQEKEKRRELQEKTIIRQQEEIGRIEQFVERFRYKATKASQVQSRLKMLEKMDILHEEAGKRAVAIHFPPCEKSGKNVLSLTDIRKDYDSLQVLQGIDLNLYRGEKVAFVGVNGAGKSTLFRLMAGVEEPTSGTVTMGLNVKMAFFSQESAVNLNYDHHVWTEVQSVPSKANDQERRNLLGAFLFSGDDVYKPVSVLSGGEKSRLTLLRILLQGSNFLILDEPTNHLDLKTKEIFQDALLQYEGTLAIVSHDRYFLDHLASRVIELSHGQAIEYSGDYSYFIEKRRENQLLQKEEGVKQNGTDTEQTAEDYPGYKTRDVRRREAEERNRLSRNLKPLREKLTSLEAEIAHLEARQNDYETELCQPDIHTRPDRIRNLSQEIKTIRQQLEDRYEQWAEIMEQIDTETQNTTT